MDVGVDVHPEDAIAWRIIKVVLVPEFVNDGLVVATKMHLRLLRLIPQVHGKHGPINDAIPLQLVDEDVYFLAGLAIPVGFGTEAQEAVRFQSCQLVCFENTDEVNIGGLRESAIRDRNVVIDYIALNAANAILDCLDPAGVFVSRGDLVAVLVAGALSPRTIAIGYPRPGRARVKNKGHFLQLRANPQFADVLIVVHIY